MTLAVGERGRVKARGWRLRLDVASEYRTVATLRRVTRRYREFDMVSKGKRIAIYILQATISNRLILRKEQAKTRAKRRNGKEKRLN